MQRSHYWCEFAIQKIFSNTYVRTHIIHMYGHVLDIHTYVWIMFWRQLCPYQQVQLSKYCSYRLEAFLVIFDRFSELCQCEFAKFQYAWYVGADVCVYTFNYSNNKRAIPFCAIYSCWRLKTRCRKLTRWILNTGIMKPVEWQHREC